MTNKNDAFTAQSITLENAVMLLSQQYSVHFYTAFNESLKPRSAAAHYAAVHWPHLALARDEKNRGFADAAMGKLGLGAFVDTTSNRVALYLFDSAGLESIDSAGIPAPLREPSLLIGDYGSTAVLATAIEKEVDALLRSQHALATN